MPTSAFTTGFALSATLIIAIGAQNSFVLRQGLRREHVMPIVAFCAIADLALISAGVAGLAAVLGAAPMLTLALTIGGTLFLLWYGLRALRRAFQPQALRAADSGRVSLRGAVAQAAAFTFLNPHVYLDTVVLLGSLSAAYEGVGRLAYGAGAAVASFIWFFGLGYGARLLQPVFARPAAWRVLDVLIGIVMSLLALSLLFRFSRGG